MKYRIKQIVDSNNVSRFIPQGKSFGLYWSSWCSGPYGNVEFGSYQEAVDFLEYKYSSRVLIHEYN